MPTEKKAQVINQLEEMFARSSVGVVTEHRGIATADINGLRRKLRDSQVQYRVVKNTLARMAASKAGKEKLADFFRGPTAIAFGYAPDVTLPVKVLADYLATSKINVSIKAGFIGDRIFTANEMIAISKLPSREQLLGKVVGGMLSPIYGLVNCLSSPMRGLAIVLQGRIKQLEGN